jgi:hypothetical protein
MSNRIPILAEEIRSAHMETAKALNVAAERALEAGAALVEAKSLVGHGEWLPFLASTGVPERTARRYMLLHRAGFKSAMVADIGINSAERFASAGLAMLPAEGRARCAGGFENAGVHRLESLAYWWQEAEGIVYWSVQTIDDEAIEVRPRALVPPWFLAALHNGAHNRFENYGEHEVPVGEAIAFINEVGGAGGGK